MNNNSCEAVGEDKALVKELLLNLYDTLRIRNILRAISILEAQWEAPEAKLGKSLLQQLFKLALQLTCGSGIRINRLHSLLNFDARLEKASRGDLQQCKRTRLFLRPFIGLLMADYKTFTESSDLT